jgi:hypothetical protein
MNLFDALARRCEMTVILMNTEECDIGHEALLLKEYSEEVMYAGQNPQNAQLRERLVVREGNHARDRERSLMAMLTLSPALVEVGDKFRLIRSTAFPPCP